MVGLGLESCHNPTVGLYCSRMPTVVRKDGFSIHVFAPPREHPPPHVHVRKEADVVVIRLSTSGGAPTISAVFGMSPNDVAKAYRLVQEHEGLLLSVWRALH